jgi:hypothetical protein
MMRIKRLYWRYERHKEAVAKKKWQHANNPEGVSRPVFLAGCARSGTTMTAKALDKSLEVDFYSDGNPRAFNKWYLRDFYTIHKLIEGSYSRVLLFHTNNELFRLHHLLEQYPGAKAIVVFRHYADVVNSTLRNEWRYVKGQVVFNLKLFKRLFEDGRYEPLFDYLDDMSGTPLKLDPGNWTRSTNPAPMLDSPLGEAVCYAVHWLLCARFVMDHNLVNDERVILVNYGKTVNAPEVYLRKICDFIGVEYHSYMVNGIHAKSVRKHKPPDLPKRLEEQCRILYDKLIQFESMQVDVD